MGSNDKTDRFRPVFEPEDIFDRFVKNANASTEEKVPRDDEPTGRVPLERVRAKAKKESTVEPVPKPPARPVGVHDAPTRVRDFRVPDDASPAEPRVRVPIKVPVGLGGAADKKRGGPPAWDHAITVKAPAELLAEVVAGDAAGAEAPDAGAEAIEVRAEVGDVSEREGTRPDAPLPLAMQRAFDPDAEVDDGATQPFEARMLELAEVPSSMETRERVEIDVDSEDEQTRPRHSPLTESGNRVLLLTRVKRPLRDIIPSEVPGERPPSTTRAPIAIPEPDSSGSHQLSVSDTTVSVDSGHDLRLEAMRVIPDVEAAARRAPDTFVSEGGEAGQMPTRELDSILSDMAVLLRYGHAGQVHLRLEQLLRTYPEDLLLMRRVAEFYVEHDQEPAALEVLFALAKSLFERGNVEGMRQALQQVLILDPENARAFRLLGLLEQRETAR